MLEQYLQKYSHRIPLNGEMKKTWTLMNTKQKNNDIQQPSQPKRIKKMCCSCKKTKCLKLYCDCFTSG